MCIPNCVQEYYRELEEREERRYEQQCKREEYYTESRRKLEFAKENGWPILHFCGYDECRNCKYKIDVQVDEDDDMCTLICLDSGCVCHKGDV